MLFYVIRVFHICIAQLSHIERKRFAHIEWPSVDPTEYMCVCSLTEGPGGSEELRRATDIWVGPTFVTARNTPILLQLLPLWEMRQALWSQETCTGAGAVAATGRESNAEDFTSSTLRQGHRNPLKTQLAALPLLWILPLLREVECYVSCLLH